jgi:predicted aconitase with swiveling domain
MVKSGVGPVGLVMRSSDTIVAVGAIIAELACVDQVSIDQIESDAWVEIEEGAVRVHVG